MTTKLLYLTTQDRFFLSHVKERALYAQEHGYTIFVAAQKTNEELVKEIESFRFVFYDTGIERQALGPFTQLRALNRIRRIYQDVKPDIVHHLGAKAIIYGTLVYNLFQHKGGIVNAPIGLGYVYASNDLKAHLLRPVVTLLYKLFLNPKNSQVIVENPDDINFFVDIGALDRSKSHCIYGAGVNTEEFCPSNDKNEVCTVVMTARLIKEKGVFEFIEAAHILKEKNVPVRMQLVGAPDFGNPNSLTAEQVQALKTDPSIEYLGFKTNIAEILKRAHICCLPSYYREGLPRSLIEGAACGLAIITTDTVGCREVVRNHNGILIQTKNPQELFQTITKLAHNPEQCYKFGKLSRSLCLTQFSTNRINQETYQSYQILQKIVK